MIVVADIVILPSGSIHFGLVIASCDRNITASLSSDTRSPPTRMEEADGIKPIIMLLSANVNRGNMPGHLKLSPLPKPAVLVG